MLLRPKPVDVLYVGAGATTSIVAGALADAGLSGLALERRPAAADAADEAAGRQYEDLGRSTLTFRNAPGETALPLRKPRSPAPDLPGETRIWRSLPADLRMRSHILERYGAAAIPADMSIQDWPIGYDELEPFHDWCEQRFGASGRAGNLLGRLQPGGNPFEGPRRRDFPKPPAPQSYGAELFARAAAELGRRPFPVPAAPRPSAATGGPKLALKTGCEVLKINLDPDRRRATGVTYVDATGRELVQRAEIVVLTAGVLDNVRLLLLSDIGRPYDLRTGTGVIGRNYAVRISSEARLFFDDESFADELTDPRLDGPGMAVDDFNSDNFNHAGLGFVGGGYIRLGGSGAQPVEPGPTPAGTPKWGAGWKRAAAHWRGRSAVLQCHGGGTARRSNFLDLDPTYRDVWGRPLLRMTFDFPENDQRMSAFLTDRAVEIGRAMRASRVQAEAAQLPCPAATCQAVRGAGGAIMGDDPRTSAVNRYLQSWDIPNLFVVGASAFPQAPAYDPEGALGALAGWCAAAIRGVYLRSPGPMASL